VLTAYSPSAIYRSVDSGTNWMPTSAPDNRWRRVASSADGNRLLAAADEDSSGVVLVPLYLSTNAGISWFSTGSPAKYWFDVTLSADGSRAAAIGYIRGGIWTSQTPPAPRMNLNAAGANLRFSWTLPSANFVLQQSANLTSWSNVPSPPVLNLTNLQYEVILQPTNARGFYRLKTP